MSLYTVPGHPWSKSELPVLVRHSWPLALPGTCRPTSDGGTRPLWSWHTPRGMATIPLQPSAQGRGSKISREGPWVWRLALCTERILLWVLWHSRPTSDKRYSCLPGQQSWYRTFADIVNKKINKKSSWLQEMIDECTFKQLRSHLYVSSWAQNVRFSPSYSGVKKKAPHTPYRFILPYHHLNSSRN